MSNGSYKASISPISIRIEGVDDNVQNIEIEYIDGSVYRIDKYGYVNTFAEAYLFDGDGNGEQDFSVIQIMFNRIIDINEVSRVRFNGIELR